MKEAEAKKIAELIDQVLTKQKGPGEVRNQVLKLTKKVPIGYKPISL